MFKDGDIVCIFLRNGVLRLRQKPLLLSVPSRPSECITVPPLTKLMARQFLPENHGNVRQRLGIRIK